MNLFQEVIVDMSSDWIAFEVKVDVHVLPESTRIVISICLGVSKGFQNAVRL